MERVKNSVGIRAFCGNATRFMPSKYHAKAEQQSMPDKVSVVEGLAS